MTIAAAFAAFLRSMTELQPEPSPALVRALAAFVALESSGRR
jgi:hypothetical protein